MSNKISWHQNGTITGETNGNLSSNFEDLNNNNKRKKTTTKLNKYNSIISKLSILFLIVNIIFYMVVSLNKDSILRLKGKVICYSSYLPIIIVFISIIILPLIRAPYVKHKKSRIPFSFLGFVDFIINIFSKKKEQVKDNLIILNEVSYKKVKKRLFITEVILIMSYLISVIFFSNPIYYKNGVLYFDKTFKTTEIKLSDIDYINVYCKEYEEKSDKHLSLYVDYCYHKKVQTLVECNDDTELPPITSFLEYLKKNYNFQDVSVSNNDVRDNIKNGTTFKHLPNSKPPIFYVKMFPNQLTNIENSSMATESEKYLNERNGIKKYSDYIKGK